jgi:hypothetical protein
MPAMARTGGEEKKVIVIGQRGGAKGGVFSFLVTPQLGCLNLDRDAKQCKQYGEYFVRNGRSRRDGPRWQLQKLGAITSVALVHVIARSGALDVPRHSLQSRPGK